MDTCTIKFEQKLSRILTEDITADGIILAINQQRRIKHLQPVRPNKRVTLAARIQTRQIILSGKFGHVIQGAKFPKLADRMRASGHTYASAGEVLYAGVGDAEMVVQAWLGSKPHQEAILHPDVREIGASVEPSGNRTFACAVLCIPTDAEEEEKNEAKQFGDQIIDTAKEYGKAAAKKLLTKAVQSNAMKDIIQSPIVQKIIAMLK